MTVAELERTIAEHAATSADDLADVIYVAVKRELHDGPSRSQVYDTLRRFYASAQKRGLRRERRALGEVLACLDGYCSPAAALVD